MFSSRKTPLVMSSPYLTWAVIFIIVPIGMIFYYGLTDTTGAFTFENIASITQPEHAKALWLINQKGVPGETYNIGGHNERTNLQVVQTICRILDELRPKAAGKYEEQIAFVSDRPGHDLRYAIDADKLRNELGWQPEENFDTGIRRTVQWYLDNAWWWQPIRERKYAGERLGKGIAK